MYHTSRIASIWLLTLLFLAGGAGPLYAAAPKRVTLDQGGKKMVVYMRDGKRYRLCQPAELKRREKGARVCVEGKLADARAGTLRLHGAAFNEITFRLPASMLVSAPLGSNVWVGGTVKDEGGLVTLAVDGVEKLASDVVLFQARWGELEKRKDASPEDFLRLGWWVERGKSLATGVSAEEFAAYNKAIEQSYGRGLELEGVQLASLASKTMHLRLKRYRAFVDSFGSSVPDGHAAWQLAAYRKLLHENADSLEVLAAKEGELTDGQKQQLLAGFHLLVGRMRLRYLKDKDGAADLYRKGALFSPTDPGLSKELRAVGYVRYEDTWVSPAEAKALKQKADLDRRRAAAAKARKEAEKARAEARKRLTAGQGMRRIRTTVDPLLSEPTAENLAELGEALKTFSEDVARYALWQAAVLPATADISSLLADGLRVEHASVRTDVLDLLGARAQPEDVEEIVRHLSKEKDDAVALHAVEVARRIPEEVGIDALVQVMGAGSSRPAARELAARYLQQETGQAFGKDGFRWREWWKKNQFTFTRKPMEK